MVEFNTKLSDIQEATAPTGGELVYIVQGGNSRKLTLGKTGAALLDDTGQTQAKNTLGIGSAGSKDESYFAVAPYDTLAAAQAATIPTAVKGVTTLGHTTHGDGGAADWIDTGEQPTTHDAWFKDAANHYFIIRNPRLDIRQFGVFGSDDTGTMTNEGTNILKAITAAIKLKRTLFVPGTNYQTGAVSYTTDDINLAIEGEHASQPKFHATLAVANATGGAGRLFQFLPGGSSYTSNEVGSYTLATSISPFQQKITLNTTVGLERGMMIQIVSDQPWYYDDRSTYYRGEIHLIQRVLAGNQIQIDDYTRDVYLTTQTITVRVWRPRHFVMNNIGIVYPDPTDTGANTRGIVIDRMMKPEFNDCFVKGPTGSGILNSRSWLAKYNNLEVQDVGRALSASSSIGYGINEASVYGTIIDGIKSRGCRRTIDFDSLTSQTLNAPARDCIVKNFHVTGAGVDGVGSEFFPGSTPSAPNYGIGGHGPVENLIIKDGYISDVTQGINIRSRNTVISGVHFAGRMEYCFFGTFGTGLSIKDSRYMRDDYPDKTSDTGAANTYFTSLPYSFARFGISTGTGDWDYESPVVIQGCEAHGLQRSFVEFGVTAAGPIAIENLNIQDNTARLHIPTGSNFKFFFVNDSGDARFSRSKIGPNLMVNRGAGTTDMFHFSAMNLANVNQGGVDAAVEIGDHEYIVTIPDDSVAVIRNASRYSTDRLAIRMTDQSGAMFGDFIVVNASATLTTLGATPATLAGSAAGSALTGTTGTDGNFTVGLTAPNFYMENRTGGTRRMRVKIL